MYGEDGLDVCKSRYLNEKGIPFLVDNSECIRLSQDSPNFDPEAAEAVKAARRSVCWFVLHFTELIFISCCIQVKSWFKKKGTLKKTDRTGGFLKFSAQFQDQPEVEKEEIVNRWRALSHEEKLS